jgi:hypothetical protein
VRFLAGFEDRFPPAFGWRERMLVMTFCSVDALHVLVRSIVPTVGEGETPTACAVPSKMLSKYLWWVIVGGSRRVLVWAHIHQLP